MKFYGGVRGDKGNKQLDFGSNLDYDLALAEVRDDCILFGGKGAWNMVAVCGYLVMKERHRMAI